MIDRRYRCSILTNGLSTKFLSSAITSPSSDAFDIIRTTNLFFSNCLIASVPGTALIFSNAGTNIIMHCTITNNIAGISNVAFSSNRIHNNNIDNLGMNLASMNVASYAASNFFGTRAFTQMKLLRTNHGVTPWRNMFGGRNGDWVLPPSPNGCIAATNLALGQIVIQWQQIALADFSNYQVYRTQADSFSNLSDASRVFTGFNSTVTQFVENDMVGGVYRYYATVMDTNGNESWYSPMGIVTNNTIVASNANTFATYTNLQQAINAAAGGHTIIAYRTRHIGNYVIDRSLTLRSRDWIDFGENMRTIIESPSLTTDPLMLSNPAPISVTVEGFNICRGQTGVRVQSNVTANILNNVICSNESRGVLLNIGSLYCTIISNRIFSNAAQNFSGHGIYLNTNFGGALIEYNIIENNNGDTPYGIFARSSSNLLQIRYNTIVSNISARTNTGGGIRIEDCFSEVIGNTIGYNGKYACEGGGIVISNIAASTNLIADNIITHHLASNYSYGIYVITNAPLSLMIISNNSISSNGLSVISNLRARGVFVAAGGGTYVICDNTIAENRDAINCGGVGVHFNTGTFANAFIERNNIVRSGQSGISAFSTGAVTIRSNSIRDSGIAMSLASGAWEAFGIYASKSSALVIDGNTVTGTTSVNVTNIYGISVGTNASIINNTVVSNMPPNSKYACGIDMYGPCHYSLVSNNYVAYNAGTNTGYGIQVFASVPASNRFINNTVVNNRDFGIIMSGTNRSTVISGSAISSNGGYGIYIGTVASANRIVSNSIVGNKYAGVMLNNAAVATNIICSNIILGPGQEEGINLSSCPSNLIFRNVIADHMRGVSVVMANSNDIFNNTIYNNGNGIDWSTATNVRIRNNIIFGSTNIGVNDSGASGNSEINYTVFYNNAFGDTNVSARNRIGPSNMSGADPYIDTFGSYDILSPMSMAVDRGTNIPGISSTFLSNGPDIGWRESAFSSDQALFVCAITNPPANQWIGTPIVNFSGSAGASVTGVYFGTNSTMGLVSGTGVWTTNTIDVSMFSNATNVFYAAASNASGTLFTNVQTNFFDFTAPEVSFTAPVALEVISNTVIYQGSNVDTSAPVMGFWYNVNGGVWSSVPVETNWSGDIDTTMYPNGIFVVGIRSSNAAGLVSYAYRTNYVDNIPPMSATYKYPTNAAVSILTYSNAAAFPLANPPPTFGIFAGELIVDPGTKLNAPDAVSLNADASSTAMHSGFRYKIKINESLIYATNTYVRWRGYTDKTSGGVYVWKNSAGAWARCGAVPAANADVISNAGPLSNYATNEYGTNYIYIIASAIRSGGAGTIFGDYVEARIDSSPGVPGVNNDAGASNITFNSAQLNGVLEYDSGVNTTVRVYWGSGDGGTTPASWANMIDLGTRSIGGFSTNVYGLSPGTTHYYRTLASNVYGTNWAGVTSNFTTMPIIIATNFTIGGAGYYSLQAAVNAASAGHEIRVLATNLTRSAGQLNALSMTNAVFITNRNDLRVIGGYGPAFAVQTGYTVLDGLGATAVSNRLVYIANLTNLMFDGFVIRGGGSNGGVPILTGTGVIASNVSNSIFSNIVVSNNCSSNGGGMYIADSVNSVYHGVIADNKAYNSAGGMYFMYGSNNTIGGMIVGNTASNSGGGVCTYYSRDSRISADLISNTSSNFAAGAYLYASSNMSVSGRISYNTASNAGGGLYLNLSFSNDIASAVVNNSSSNFGGGVYSLNSSSNRFTGSISSNASKDAGGLYMSLGVGNSISATVNGNTATNIGGGLYILNNTNCSVSAVLMNNSASNFGGGIYFTGGSNIIISGSYFSNNSAGATNASISFTNSTAAVTNDPFTISNCTFFGGGANSYAIIEHGTKDITNQTIVSNIFWTNTLSYLYGDLTGIISNNQVVLLNTPNTRHDAIASAKNAVMPVIPLPIIATNATLGGAGYSMLQDAI
ncbi:MAG: right-handed parallel beta-helix repeat-containing protein, partial [Spirochaetota bacterium]